MKRKNPPFVHEYVNQHGTAKFYFRRVGQPKIRLPGLPWSPEFMAAYECAKSGQWTKSWRQPHSSWHRERCSRQLLSIERL